MVTHTLATQTGKIVPGQHITPNQLFPTYAIPGGSWHSFILGKIWGAFRSLGEFTSSIIAILVIFRIFWYLLKLMVNCRYIYNAHGCNEHLLWAFCSEVFFTRHYQDVYPRNNTNNSKAGFNFLFRLDECLNRQPRNNVRDGEPSSESPHLRCPNLGKQGLALTANTGTDIDCHVLASSPVHDELEPDGDPPNYSGSLPTCPSSLPGFDPPRSAHDPRRGYSLDLEYLGSKDQPTILHQPVEPSRSVYPTINLETRQAIKHPTPGLINMGKITNN